MSDKIGIGLLEKLSLRNWYRYLLYVSGILLILGSLLDTQIEHSKIIDFSMWTIGISVFVWLVDTVLDECYDYYEHERRVMGSEHYSDGQKYAIAVSLTLNFVFFFIWAIFVARKLF